MSEFMSSPVPPTFDSGAATGSAAFTPPLAAPRRMTARRRLIAASRKLRELGSIGSALANTSHPYMAHIVPMRRCNLACTYCNEYDDVSDPVPLAESGGSRTWESWGRQ
jgi:sulfatase maturation enzyme AslB (radical SAM superfamily)